MIVYFEIYIRKLKKVSISSGSATNPYVSRLDTATKGFFV